MHRKATAKDVAALAGVSRSAVSMVLNGHGAGNIAVEKQAAIRAAAEQLQYRPDAVALSLRSRRTRTIGVVTDAIASSAHGGGVLKGATDAAAAAGYVLTVVDTHDDPEIERRGYATLHDRRVDGLLFAAKAHRAYSPPAVMTGGPAVLANCFDPDDAVTAFLPDDLDGGRRAANVLLDAGHREIRLLAGPAELPGLPEHVAAGLRAEGFAEALRDAGLDVAAPVAAGWEIADGYAAATAVLDNPDRPTGLVAANDRCAVGVVLAAARLGLDVPRDVSVVGYDDDPSIAWCMVPPLTTLRLPHLEMGRLAVEHLLSMLDEPSGAGRLAPARALVPCPLVHRGSVAPPRRVDPL